jgi:hypothetical protein
MSRSRNVHSKHEITPRHVCDSIERKRLYRERTGDNRAKYKRDVRVLVDSILEDTLDESGDE